MKSVSCQHVGLRVERGFGARKQGGGKGSVNNCDSGTDNLHDTYTLTCVRVRKVENIRSQPQRWVGVKSDIAKKD